MKKASEFPVFIREEVIRLSVEKRKTPVTIIGEANYINNAMLNAVDGAPRLINII